MRFFNFQLITLCVTVMLYLSACDDGSCDDGIWNQDETDVDCGGPCPDCGTCFDGIMSPNETGVDCGGSCAACETCSDGIKNQDETGIDCGGVCPECVPITATCTITENTAVFPFGMQTQSYYYVSCATSSGDYKLSGSSSAGDITINFGEILAPETRLYTTQSSSQLGSLNDGELILSTIAGGILSYLYYAGSGQDVYVNVNVNPDTVRVEFCSLIFNSGSSDAIDDLEVSGHVACY